MFSKLKQCTTLKEIFVVLGTTWISKILFPLLVILIITPVYAMKAYVMECDNLEWDWAGQRAIWSDYECAVCVIGLLILILFGILILRQWIIVYDAKWKNVLLDAKAHPWNVFLLAMLLWSLLSTFFSKYPLKSFLGNEYRFEGILMYVIYMGIYGSCLFLKDEQKKRWVLWGYSLAATVLCVLMLAQEWDWFGIREVFFVQGAAVFFNPNHFGYYLNMSILVLSGLLLYETKRRRQIVLLLLLLFQIYVMIINDTFGCYLAMTVTTLVLIVFTTRNQRSFSPKYLVPFAVVLLLSVCNVVGILPKGSGKDVQENLSTFFYDIGQVAGQTDEMEQAGSSRMGLWMKSIEMTANKPFFGYGPDAAEVDEICNFSYWRPHNEYLQHALYLGIPGLFFYLAALLGIGINRWKKLRVLSPMQVVAGGCVVTYLISACFGNTMFYTTPYFWMFLGFLL